MEIQNSKFHTDVIIVHKNKCISIKLIKMYHKGVYLYFCPFILYRYLYHLFNIIESVLKKKKTKISNISLLTIR